MSYTVEDLDQAVAARVGATADWPSEGGWQSFPWARESFEIPGIGTLQVLEYQDEEFETQCWLVVRITDPEGNVRLFKRNGWRASHDGSYLEGPTFEVKEFTETVTVTNYYAITAEDA